MNQHSFFFIFRAAELFIREYRFVLNFNEQCLMNPSRFFSYSEYNEHINNLFQQGKTTGDNHSESMLNYTKLNLHRIKRLDKTVKIDDSVTNKIKSISKAQEWWVITEAWCGDAAQNVPVLNKMAELNDNISLKLILRDENLEIMDKHLTNGARSIPKLIVKSNGDPDKSWGPRPAELQKLVLENKNKATPVPYSEFSKTVQQWYNTDKGMSVQQEVLELLGL